jgi:hypothetical protein
MISCGAPTGVHLPTAVTGPRYQMVKTYKIINVSMELRFFTIVFLVLVVSGCPVYDPPTGVLTIVNSSGSSWYVYDSCGSLSNEKELAYHFSWNAEAYDQYGNEMEFPKFPFYRVDPGDSSYFRGYGNLKRPRIHCKEGKLNLFFISEEDMRERTWAEIVEYQIYSHKYSLSQKELDSLNWVVDFR